MNGMQDLEWSVHDFAALSVDLLHAILKLRVDVFVVEQECPYPEVDGRDPDALHLVARQADGTLVAFARILPPEAMEFRTSVAWCCRKSSAERA